MPYAIEYSPDAEDHLRALTARQRSIVLDSVDSQLAYQPGVETRNRKPMRPNPVAPWELRIGDLRAYNDIVEKLEKCVLVLGVCCRDQAPQFSPDRWGGDSIMKTIEIAEAREALGQYAGHGENLPLVVMDHGRPVAALLAVPNVDLETVSLSTTPAFVGLLT